jgi:hypothetical protein
VVGGAGDVSGQTLPANEKAVAVGAAGAYNEGSAG